MKGDPDKLYVEVSAGGSYERALRAGADAALSRIAFAVPVDDRGEIELQVDVAGIDEAGGETLCRTKVVVVRLPNHSLLGIAEGSARTRGVHDAARADCVERLTTTLVRGKVRALLRAQVRAKR